MLNYSSHIWLDSHTDADFEKMCKRQKDKLLLILSEIKFLDEFDNTEDFWKLIAEKSILSYKSSGHKSSLVVCPAEISWTYEKYSLCGNSTYVDTRIIIVQSSACNSVDIDLPRPESTPEMIKFLDDLIASDPSWEKSQPKLLRI